MIEKIKELMDKIPPKNGQTPEDAEAEKAENLKQYPGMEEPEVRAQMLVLQHQVDSLQEGRVINNSTSNTYTGDTSGLLLRKEPEFKPEEYTKIKDGQCSEVTIGSIGEDIGGDRYLIYNGFKWDLNQTGADDEIGLVKTTNALEPADSMNEQCKKVEVYTKKDDNSDTKYFKLNDDLWKLEKSSV